jgi:hypothetical protein
MQGNQPMQAFQTVSPPHHRIFNGRGARKGAPFPLALARGGARQARGAWGLGGQLQALISAPSGSTARASLGGLGVSLGRGHASEGPWAWTQGLCSAINQAALEGGGMPDTFNNRAAK